MKLRTVLTMVAAVGVSLITAPVAHADWATLYRQDFTQDVALGAWPGPYQGSVYAFDGYGDYTNTAQYHPKDSLSVHDGVLDMWAHQRNRGATHCTGCVLRNGDWWETVGSGIRPLIGGGMVHGRVIVRLGVFPDTGGMRGWGLASLLWPTSGNWADGEIDWPEGGLNAAVPVAFNHSLTNPGRNCSQQYNPQWRLEGWHDYFIDWTPTYFRFYRDGVALGTSTCALPTDPMNWVLQMGTNGTAPAADSHGHLLVDYVQIDGWR